MKNLIVTILLATCAAVRCAQERYMLASHILDITSGKPAPGVKITLSKLQHDTWVAVDEKTTDDNGRVGDFLPQDDADHRGIYRLPYPVAPYFARRKQQSFYPFIEVMFEIGDGDHYHVPITLSPYGYSTYRGN